MKIISLENSKPFLNGIALSLLFVLCAWVQTIYDTEHKPFTHKFEAVDRTLMPAPVLKTLSFGFNNILADMYWIRTVQDLIQWNETDRFYLQYFDNISTLDPKFAYPYLFGIFVVPTAKSPQFLDEFSLIADRGISALPENWEIPFYLSTKYKSITKDYERADHYLEIAAQKEKAPEVVHTVYSAFKVNKEKDREQVSQMIKVIYDTTDNETIKSLAAKGLVINDLTNTVEKAIARFKIRYNSYPRTLKELEDTKLIVLPQETKELFDVAIKEDGSFRLIEKR